MSTLIYHAGALGDFITTIPAIRLWKKIRGTERIVLLGKPEFGRFALDSGLIDECLDAGSLKFLPLFSKQSVPEIHRLLSPFANALLFAAPGSPIINHATQCGIAVHRQPPFPSERIHITEYHCSLFIDPRCVSFDESMPLLVIPPEIREATRALVPADEIFVTLHPGSGSKKKNWPFDRFLAIAERFRAQKFSILWIKGPAEESLTYPPHDYIAAGQNLSIVAALLYRSRLFVGNDSGITHLAAAMGCPTVALFGPSDPAVWAPRGKRVSVLCKNKPCGPCHLRLHSGPIPCDASCLADISVDEVLEKISGIIE